MRNVIEINEFVDRYNRIWNESNAGKRHKGIAELWSEESIHFTESLEARGLEAIEARIFSVYEKFVGTGEFTFNSVNNPVGHHNAMRFYWEMVPTAGGKAVAAGSVFVLLDDNHRIRCDYQFNESIS
jgi:hypothetical protein